jgi:hypothetical protein
MSKLYALARGSLALLVLALLATANPAAAQTFTADLAGSNEVPPVETDASGSVEAELDGLTLTLSGSFEGLESDYNAEIGSHIHGGAAGQNGPVLIPLAPTLDGDNRGGTFEAANNTFTLTQGLADSLAAGLFYINIHTVDNPSGEIRGQLLEAGGGARVQVIHNAADPAAEVVDVYIEEVSTEEPAIDDFAFRTATPYLDLPAGSELTVTVAPANSSSAADGLASFPFTLESGETYQLIANGVLAPSQFEDNPNGVDIGFTLFVNGDALEASSDESVVVNVVHGATDAPTVDVVARAAGADEGAVLFDDATYGDIAPYLGVPPSNYVLDITPGDDNDTIVGSFAADLRGANGAALTVLASGFLTPDNDQDGPAFGLLAVFPDGTAALLPAVTDARVQVIHNAADPAAEVVDVYIEEVSTEEPAIDDFAFRTATPFLDLPATAPLTITVAPGDSESAEDGLASFPVDLVPGGTYAVIANGVLDPSQFEDNPDGEAIAFTLFLDADAREGAGAVEEVIFNVVHGATDAPTVDVEARGVGTLVDDATYGGVTPYLEVPAGAYTLDVTTADGETVVATFAADLSGAGGGALKVLASGFLSPDNDQDGPAFGLLAVFPDGTAALLPAGSVSNEDGAAAPASFALGGVYPNPLRASATVQFDLGTDARVSVEVFDVLGRRVLQVAPASMAAGTAQEIALDASALPSGAYLYRLTAETATESIARTGRFTVVR